jgi:uncharacterized protein (TIGR02145 family)
MNLRFPAPVGTVCGQTITYAGESYPTVQIGTKGWMSKNLNVGTLINGNFNQTNNNILEKYCWNNDTTNCTTYGGLYQWAEVVQYQNGASNTSSPSPAFTGNVRGICPVGWCLPSNADWTALENELGGVNSAGVALKATSFRGNNSSGFNALLSGYRTSTGSADLGGSTSFWTSTEISPTATMNRYLD